MGAGLGLGSDVGIAVNGSSMVVGVGREVGTEVAIGASSGRALGVVFELCFKGLSVRGGVVD